MKRILILITFLSSFVLADAQYKTYMSLDTFPVPSNLTAFTFISSKSNVAYIWSVTLKRWVPVGGSIDSLFAGIQSQINEKVDQTTTITINGDTQDLTGDVSFGPFLTGTDTIYLHNQISLNGTNNLVFGDGLHKAGNNVVALHEEALWNASKFQGRAVSGATPLNGQVYVWSDTTLEWKPRSLSSIISSYTDENAQDAIGAMVTSKFTYNDGSNSLDINQSNLSLSSIGGSLNVSQINATGTPSSSTVLYGNGTWGTIGSGVQAHGVSILKNYVTQTTSTGSGTTDNITIVNIPANTLGANGDGIEIEYAFTTTGVDTKSVGLNIGSSSTLIASSAATTAATYSHKVKLYRTSSTGAIYRAEGLRDNNQFAISQSVNTSFDWTTSQDVKVSITSTTAASITINYVTVKVVKE